MHFLINLNISGISLPYLRIVLTSSTVSVGPILVRFVLLHIGVKSASEV